MFFKFNLGNAIANYDSVEDGEKIINTAIERYGKIDILINNAGILRDRSFLKMSEADWDKVFEVLILILISRIDIKMEAKAKNPLDFVKMFLCWFRDSFVLVTR